MHSTHFILRLYGIRHKVKDHSDSERGNLLLPHGQLFLQKLFYTHHPRQDSIYHNLCYTCHGALTGMRNSSIALWRIDLITHCTMSEHSTMDYILLLKCRLMLKLAQRTHLRPRHCWNRVATIWNGDLEWFPSLCNDVATTDEIPADLWSHWKTQFAF